jgi:hypothetical protein
MDVSMERLCEMVTEPRTALEVSILPFGKHNRLWKQNREIFDRITVRSFLDRPFCGRPLDAETERVVIDTLGERFIGPIKNVPGPVLDRHDQVVQWLNGVAYSAMRYGDEPDEEK